MAQNLCDRGSRDVQKRHRHGVPEASILGSGKWKFLSAALSLGRPDKKPALALFSAFLRLHTYCSRVQKLSEARCVELSLQL